MHKVIKSKAHHYDPGCHSLALPLLSGKNCAVDGVCAPSKMNHDAASHTRW